LNLNSPDLIILNKKNLEVLRDTKSNFSLFLVPLEEQPIGYSLLVEVRDQSGNEIVAKGLIYSKRNDVRKFRLEGAMKFIQDVCPNHPKVTVLTWSGQKVFK